MNSRGSSNPALFIFPDNEKATRLGGSDWWALRGWRRIIALRRAIINDRRSFVNERANESAAKRIYKTSDRSELALRLHAMLTSQMNSRGSSNPAPFIFPDNKKATRLGGSNWWALRGSNSRPSRCKRDALPAELSAHLVYESVYTLTKIINQVKNALFFKKIIFFSTSLFKCKKKLFCLWLILITNTPTRRAFS